MVDKLLFKGNKQDAERDARRTVLNAKDMKEQLLSFSKDRPNDK